MKRSLGQKRLSNLSRVNERWKIRPCIQKRVGAIGVCLLFLLSNPLSLRAGPWDSLKADEKIEGLWSYESLIPKDEKEMPLTGFFLFQNGYFIQQSINDGEPFEQQMAMANAGRYEAIEGGFKLLLEIGISVTPSTDPPLSLRRNTEHQVFPEYSEDKLSLTFGSGTIQTFKQIEAEKGEVFILDKGYLGFAGNYFILFIALENGGEAGSGTFEREGSSLRLHAMSWFSGIDGKATYLRDQEIEATFDGEKLSISDGPEFVVIKD